MSIQMDVKSLFAEIFALVEDISSDEMMEEHPPTNDTLPEIFAAMQGNTCVIPGDFQDSRCLAFNAEEDMIVFHSPMIYQASDISVDVEAEVVGVDIEDNTDNVFEETDVRGDESERQEKSDKISEK